MLNEQYNKNFDIDLGEALLREKRIERILKHSKIELKTDFMATKTGNFFIEYECNNKPSGLATTEAPFWMLEIERRCCFLVETLRLKELCRKAFKENRLASGGDTYNNHKSKGVLLPVEWLWKEGNVEFFKEEE